MLLEVTSQNQCDQLTYEAAVCQAVLGTVVDRVLLSRKYCTSLLTHASCQQCDHLYINK